MRGAHFQWQQPGGDQDLFLGTVAAKESALAGLKVSRPRVQNHSKGPE